jgi:hypothetical protein
MKSRTITIIGIFAAILMTVMGAELAFARGGAGNGGYSGGQASGNGAGMSQRGNTHQYQYKQQNQYQYRQDKGSYTPQRGEKTMQGDQAQSRIRTQLRDPSIHENVISE